MKTHMKRILALALCLLLALSASAVCFAAASQERSRGDIPVVFIAGFASSPTVDSFTGEQLFPPDADRIKAALKDSAGGLADALFRRDYSLLTQPLEKLLFNLFGSIMCDENGDPIRPGSTTGYVWPTRAEILAKRSPEAGYTAADPIRYSFDWRLDLRSLAEGLHSFLRYVCGAADVAEVNVIGSSMGACVLSAYMDIYGCEYIRDAVFMSGAFAGTTVAGEPSSGQYGFSPEYLLMFVSSLLGADLRAQLLNAAADVLYQRGIVNGVTDILENVNTAVLPELTRKVLSQIFGRMPGFWALIPYDMYETARDTLLNENASPALNEKIGYYHNVQGRVPEILSAAMKNGAHVIIVSKYTSGSIPAVPSAQNLSDVVVDTAYSSLGAVTAPIGRPFGEDYLQAKDDGHNHLSPDGYVDASACAFPEYTWFIKNITHTAHPDAQMRFVDTLLADEAQPTVWSHPEYPQFLVYTAQQELLPLSAQTDVSIGSLPERETGFFARIRRILRDYAEILRTLFALLCEKIKK